jgi:outer membrane assembly lipoprotein YfiO
MKKAAAFSLLMLTLGFCVRPAIGNPNKICSSSDNPSRQQQAEPTQLFYQAFAQIANQRYSRGRELLTEFVDSSRDERLVAAAKLIIADTYFRERDFRQAKNKYMEWARAFPDHPLAAKVAEKCLELEVLHFEEGNQNYHRKEEVVKLVENYPEFQENITAQKYLSFLQERVAEHELDIAQFYFDRRNIWKLTESHCREIVENYPKVSCLDEALWYLARALEKEDEEGADNDPYLIAQCYHRIVDEFPHSQYKNSALARLKELGWITTEIEFNESNNSSEQKSNNSSKQNKGKFFQEKYADILSAPISKEGVLLDENDQIKMDF